MLSVLNIPTLQQRRQLLRLTLFYKIINNALPISIPLHYQRTQFHTRQHHPNHFILPQVTLNTYKYIVSIQELLKIGIIYQLVL